MSQLTITQYGKVLTETQDGVTMPADYSFATVNDYVHSFDRTYEDLECLCLGMACHVDKLTRQRDELLAALELAQWVDFDDSDYGTVTFCPVCRNDKKYGHYDGCQMASAIARVKGGAA